jgi:hypothetical protein
VASPKWESPALNHRAHARETGGPERRPPSRVTPGSALGSSNNIFGPDIKRVVSTSIPVGTALLGDFSKLKIFVRRDATLALDSSGTLFTSNQFVARAEGRYGIGVLRPSAFAKIDLTAA